MSSQRCSPAPRLHRLDRLPSDDPQLRLRYPDAGEPADVAGVPRLLERRVVEERAESPTPGGGKLGHPVNVGPPLRLLVHLALEEPARVLAPVVG